MCNNLRDRRGHDRRHMQQGRPYPRLAWYRTASHANWRMMIDVIAAFPTATALNAERARFKICGNSHRLIVSFKFSAQIAWVKFIGTHAEYDKIDALTVSQF